MAKTKPYSVIVEGRYAGLPVKVFHSARNRKEAGKLAKVLRHRRDGFTNKKVFIEKTGFSVFEEFFISPDLERLYLKEKKKFRRRK